MLTQAMAARSTGEQHWMYPGCTSGVDRALPDGPIKVPQPPRWGTARNRSRIGTQKSGRDFLKRVIRPGQMSLLPRFSGFQRRRRVSSGTARAKDLIPWEYLDLDTCLLAIPRQVVVVCLSDTRGQFEVSVPRIFVAEHRLGGFELPDH